MTKSAWWMCLGVSSVLTACASQQQLTQAPVAPAEQVYNQSQDLGLACRLLMASRCAYAIGVTGQLDDKETQYWACKTEKNVIEHRQFVRGNDQINAVLAILTTDAAILAFRGTLPPGNNRPAHEVLKDWGNDLKAEPVPDPNISGLMHEGFHSAVGSTFGDLLDLLKKWKSDGKLERKKIYVTGHSKGGAMAYIAALLLSEQHIAPDAVYTFAAARAGDANFKSGYDAKHFNTWRYENRYDIVPHVPPNAADSEFVARVFADVFREGDVQYQSAGNLMYINWDGQLTAPYPGLAQERKDRFASEWARRPGEIAEVIINAHSSAIGDGYGQAVCQEPPRAPSP